MDPQSRKLLDQVRDAIRLKYFSCRTEETYVLWIRQFILFHHKRHPSETSNPEIEAFLTHLAVDRQVSASTQNQALSAILFLYRQVLKDHRCSLGNLHHNKLPGDRSTRPILAASEIHVPAELGTRRPIARVLDIV